MSPKNYTVYEHFDGFIEIQEKQEEIKNNSYNIFLCEEKIENTEDNIDSAQIVIELESSPNLNYAAASYWRRVKNNYMRELAMLNEEKNDLLKKTRILNCELYKLEIKFEIKK